MFSGLVEDVGVVESLRKTAKGSRINIVSCLVSEIVPGDSVAANGVCLTVVDLKEDSFSADVSPETFRVTTLSVLTSGVSVNLERPVQANGRLGGHFVLGHVDTIGHVLEITKEVDSWRVKFNYPAEIRTLLVQKGSIAIDGISLTIASLAEDSFEVQIVPYTWANTNLQFRDVGDAVNLECDIIGKYVARQLRDADFTER
tara:strand:- start:2385 stop:2987 length:603 start_codon:yes stop_codon:yes gene_type:complete